VRDITLSLDAELDMAEIGEYTTREWGLSQTDKYIDKLEDCFVPLVTRPELGRPCFYLHPGLHRFEKAEHVVFYPFEAQDIFIVRILHNRVLAKPRDFTI